MSSLLFFEPHSYSMELRVELNVARKTWTFDFVIKSLRLLKMLLALEFIFDLF